MKLSANLRCLFLLTFFTINHFIANAQDDSEITHGKKYFYKLEQQRLISIVNSAIAQQEKENSIVKRLVVKNDSLLNSGNIYDSVSVEISVLLTDNQHRIDSINKELIIVRQKINTTETFRKKYYDLQRTVAAIDYRTKNNSPVNEYAFKVINNRLDSSNISGEKGKLKTILKSASSQLDKEGAKAGAIDNKKDSILQSGNVDASVAGKIDTRLQLYQHRMDSLSTEIKELGRKIDSPKEFTKDFRIIKAKITLIDSVVNKGAASREYLFKMIELAAFFGPGGFIIPEGKYNIARKYFSPVIDSLVKFSNKYEKALRTASIIVNGYSDATAISSGSSLYKKITVYINDPSPTKEELNTGLSSLRAEEISKFLNKLLKEKYPEFKAIEKIVFETFEIGQGEKLPEPTIKNYTSNDARRRVVIIYWSILPIE
jgi:hypothetical protein